MAIQDLDLSANKANTFRDIVMGQFTKLTDFANVEFRGGFYTKSITKTGEEKDIYVPDTRDIFCNACYILALLLQPSFSKNMTTDFKDITKEIEELGDAFIEATSVEESVILGDTYYTDDDDKIKLEEYKNRKLIIHFKLYSRLSKELKEKNYFEIVSATYG